jgi:LPS sulfotransferase NodH
VRHTERAMSSWSSSGSRRPKRSYAICGVQRCGSSLLCEAMGLTTVAGYPSEYFLEWEDSEWARSQGVSSRQDYVDLVRATGSTENGVFGVKLMWNYFPEVLSRLGELPGHAQLSPAALLSAVFPRLRYVWITRNDQVRQAEQQPRYDFELIDNLHRLVLEGEAGWRAHFDDCGVEPLRVVYEDLVDDYEGTAVRVLGFLGLSPLKPALEGERTMVRQATALNDEWARRYVAESA